MLITKSVEGKITGITTAAKFISTILAVIVAIGGGAFFMQDRMTAIAKEMEASAVKTFQMQQQIISTEQKGLERRWDNEHLIDLRDHKLFLTKELKRDPTNELIQERLEIIQNKIDKLENKLYGN